MKNLNITSRSKILGINQSNNIFKIDDKYVYVRAIVGRNRNGEWKPFEYRLAKRLILTHDEFMKLYPNRIDHTNPEDRNNLFYYIGKSKPTPIN